MQSFHWVCTCGSNLLEAPRLGSPFFYFFFYSVVIGVLYSAVAATDWERKFCGNDQFVFRWLYNGWRRWLRGRFLGCHTSVCEREESAMHLRCTSTGCPGQQALFCACRAISKRRGSERWCTWRPCHPVYIYIITNKVPNVFAYSAAAFSSVVL